MAEGTGDYLKHLKAVGTEKPVLTQIAESMGREKIQG
jgi:hypothetical protein